MGQLSETENWIATTGLSRRMALVSGVAAAGYALAAQPVRADAITTSTEGLDAGMLRFPATGGFEMNAYRAKPAGKNNLPVILVVQEIFGLHEWVKDIVRRFAAAGYYAIAPDLYQRQGDPTQVADIPTLSQTIVSKVPDAQVMTDLDAVAAYAAGDGGDKNRVGITGFCWGGRISWLYSAHSSNLKAAVAWYGRLVGQPNPLQPQNPIDLVGRLHAPVLGLYGELDQGIPLADVEKMRAALGAGSKSRIEVYTGAGHGFLADYRPSYHEASATKAWNAALAWFGEYLR